MILKNIFHSFELNGVQVLDVKYDPNIQIGVKS
jgi:hypothetical protein